MAITYPAPPHEPGDQRDGHKIEKRKRKFWIGYCINCRHQRENAQRYPDYNGLRQINQHAPRGATAS